MIKEKECFKCNSVKPLEEFYRHSQMADGHVNKCKECNKFDIRANRKAKVDYYREYDNKRNKTEKRLKRLNENCRKDREKFPEKYHARGATYRAIRSGKLVRQPCEACSSTNNIHAHHDDYSKPLEVRWLCPIHHAEVHA